MADEQVKAMTADIETPVFEHTAFTTPKPLPEATVAIVTSASLHHPDDDDFTPGDTGYRVLSAARRDYVMGHWSPNFDTTGFAVDINTVFPIDRLERPSPASRPGWLRTFGATTKPRRSDWPTTCPGLGREPAGSSTTPRAGRPCWRREKRCASPR